MRHHDHDSKLRRANVVAGFDSQEDADDALLELRNAGIPDRRIGYYYAAEGGRMVDLLANHHRFAATIVWGIVGAALGVGAVYLLDRRGAAGPDPAGMAVTVGICVALFFGTLGEIAGLWTAAPGEDAPAPAESEAPFVMAVDARGAADRVAEILHRRSGYDLPPYAPPAVIPAHLPM
ncbi:hypothetical protein J0H58_07940 [bacterium]|nr:hypothetical protein [bacterium]